MPPLIEALYLRLFILIDAIVACLINVWGNKRYNLESAPLTERYDSCVMHYTFYTYCSIVLSLHIVIYIVNDANQPAWMV